MYTACFRGREQLRRGEVSCRYQSRLGPCKTLEPHCLRQGTLTFEFFPFGGSQSPRGLALFV